MSQAAQSAKNRICLGLLAHVDAGKTTLAEALMYEAGLLKAPGRVDHGSTAMDYAPLERERGITIFASQACLRLGDWKLTLLDTPGHVDFSAETERILRVLDYAILVISGLDGVQAHTRTLWELLQHYQIPTVVFVTKMDLARRSRAELMANLRSELSERCMDFSEPSSALYEELAMCREELLDAFLESGTLSLEEIRKLISGRECFPCWFGSGLKLEGVKAFLAGLTEVMQPPVYPQRFGARVFKITHDAQGSRLTHLKITGGSLRVRDTVPGAGPDDKVTQLRSYTGGRYVMVDEACAGDVCAVLGLRDTFAGQGFGTEAGTEAPVLEPVMEYRIVLPKGADPRLVLPKLRLLEQEDPMLRLRWDPRLQEIRIRLMGAVQQQIVKSLILDQFDLDVEISHGRVLYKETIADSVEGIGHYEPLRHYAEVHLILEPAKRGSGLSFASRCSEDVLDRNWQRLILTHLREKEHLGVLTGAPLTDVKITLAAGRAHLKHTEGGDFRQATYRAVRQGLMQASSVLLEPWYAFRLTVPTEQVGRAITDVRARYGTTEAPEDLGGAALLRGRAPVSTFNDYVVEVASYTRGQGRLYCFPDGYDLCHNPEEVIAGADYDPEADLDNTPDSVFCAHGGGFTVKWDQVSSQMHLQSVLAPPAQPLAPVARRRNLSIDEKELQAILEREFGPIRRPVYTAPKQTAVQPEPTVILPEQPKEKYLIVDGFNVIFAWKELSELARTDLDAARLQLMELLANYSAFTGAETILVFDAYKVKGGTGERFSFHGVRVVYTKENETADAYIEKLLREIGKNERVRIVTSDAMIQVSALRSGVLRISAREFEQEIDAVYGDIHTYLQSLHREKMSSVGEVLLQADPDGRQTKEP